MKFPLILTLPIIVGVVTLQSCERPPLTPLSTPTLVPVIGVAGNSTPTANATPVETSSPTATAAPPCDTNGPWVPWGPPGIPPEVAKALSSSSLKDLSAGTNSRLAAWANLLLGSRELRIGNLDLAKELFAAAEEHIDLLSKDGQLALYFGQAELSCNLGQYDIAEQYRKKAQAVGNSQEESFFVTPGILPELPTPSGWPGEKVKGQVP